MDTDRFKRWIHILHKFENTILYILLGTMVILAFTQISGRLFFGTGFFWADAILYNLVLWVCLVGAAIGTRRKEHITIDVIHRILKPTPQKIVRIFTDIFSGLVCSALTYAAIRFIIDEMMFKTQLTGNWPAWPFQLILPMAFTVIAARFFIQAASGCWTLVRKDSGN